MMSPIRAQRGRVRQLAQPRCTSLAMSWHRSHTEGYQSVRNKPMRGFHAGKALGTSLGWPHHSHTMNSRLQHRHLGFTRSRRHFSSTLDLGGVIPLEVIHNMFYSFGSVDSKGQVTLQLQDMVKMLRALGIVLSSEKVEHVMKISDKNGDGRICEDDFKFAFEWILQQGQDDRDFQAIFNMLDKDKNGSIDISELTNLHTTTRERLSLQDAQKIISSADIDGDGTLSYSEFLQFMLSPGVGWRLLTTYRVIFVTGGPASGKGTVCKAVESLTNCVHVSSGDLLRNEVEQRTPLGMAVQETMKRGELVDAATVLALLEKFLSCTPGHYALLDGFPRSLDNARDFTRLFGTPECYINFKCPEDIMLSRICKRGLTSGRSDDTEEVGKKRIATYLAQSAGPLKYFNSIGLQGYEIDASKPVDVCIHDMVNLPMFKARSYTDIHESVLEQMKKKGKAS